MRRPVERVDTMKAAVLNTFSGKFEIEDLEIGKPTHREVLVEVKACGLLTFRSAPRRGELRYGAFDQSDLSILAGRIQQQAGSVTSGVAACWDPLTLVRTACASMQSSGRA